MDVLSYPLLCAIIPWFIIGICGPCEQDLQKRWQDIDSGFGVTSQPRPSENVTAPAIAVGDGAAGQEVDVDVGDSEAISLEVIRNGVGQV